MSAVRASLLPRMRGLYRGRIVQQEEGQLLSSKSERAHAAAAGTYSSGVNFRIPGISNAGQMSFVSRMDTSMFISEIRQQS